MSTARALEELTALIADDSYAITFQTFGQYRTALLKAARSLAQPGEEALTGWTKPEEGLPELGVEVLVWSKEPWEKEPSMKFDTWDEQHEAPLSFSTQTIPIGPGWNNHDDFYSVIAWTPKPTPPGITSTSTGDSNG